MGLVGNGWANCFRTHNELTMGLPGKYPLPPVLGYEGRSWQLMCLGQSRRRCLFSWAVCLCCLRSEDRNGLGVPVGGLEVQEVGTRWLIWNIWFVEEVLDGPP